MKKLLIVIGVILLTLSLGSPIAVGEEIPNYEVGITVCAYDTTTTPICDFMADGVNDEEQINQALSSLPTVGGLVYLAEGNFSIGDSGVAHGGVVITKGGTHLKGSGLGTKLTLIAGTLDTNAIEVVGDEIANVVISDLWIDANRANQQTPTTSTFQSNGIRVSSQSSATGVSNASNITVRNVRVEECATLCVMMRGSGLSIEDSWFGNAHSDVVEILQGPGRITNNHFSITAQTGVVISTDAANDVTISGNIVMISSKGVVGTGIRTWQGFRRNNIENNMIIVESGGVLDYAMRIGASRSIVSGNTIQTSGSGRPIVLISASPILMTGNYLYYTDIKLDVAWSDVLGGGDIGVVVEDNFLYGVGMSVAEGVLRASSNYGYHDNLTQENKPIIGPFSDQIVGSRTNIADNTATGFLKINVPNDDIQGQVLIDYLVNTQGFLRKITGQLHLTVGRTTNSNTVVALSESVTQQSILVAGAEAISLSFSTSTPVGRASEAQTFTVQAHIDSSSNLPGHVRYRADSLSARYNQDAGGADSRITMSLP